MGCMILNQGARPTRKDSPSKHNSSNIFFGVPAYLRHGPLPAQKTAGLGNNARKQGLEHVAQPTTGS
ncbi:hypothetical protein GN956_G6542 [Arapaima gigas]